MSAAAPSLPIPYVSVPVDRFEIHNGPSRAWVLRAQSELAESRKCDDQPGTYCYMKLTTGASSLEFQRHVEIINIQLIEDTDNEVSITIQVFGFRWSGRYNMHSREGWVDR